MGYRRIPVIHTLNEIEGYDGLIVRMKGLKIGRMRKLVRLMDDDTKTGETLDEIIEMLIDGLVSWNMEDEEGVPIPSGREQMEDLEYDLVTALVNSWMDVVTGVGTDLGKDSSDGEKFPGRPLTMEAL